MKNASLSPIVHKFPTYPMCGQLVQRTTITYPTAMYTQPNTLGLGKSLVIESDVHVLYIYLLHYSSILCLRLLKSKNKLALIHITEHFKYIHKNLLICNAGIYVDMQVWEKG